MVFQKLPMNPDTLAYRVSCLIKKYKKMQTALCFLRELLSWYTLSQNPHMPHVLYAAIPPVWVCCDMSDTAGTAWLGAESICTDNKVNAIKLYSVCCKGATVENSSLITLDELKQEHQRRHHATTVTTKGCAQYSLLGATVVENSIIESNRSVIADFQWRNVEKVLETPPLSAHAALFIKVTVGDMKSSTYQTYKELEFLDILAEGLRTGETEWLDPPDPKSAVDLTRALIEELENIGNNIQGQAAKATESATRLNIFDSVILERGDLDFTEQLWVKMRRSVTSYQDVTDCLKMVIKAVRYGQIKPWIHRNSSNSLSKLILQSYQQQQQQQVDTISLTGLMPIQMLLEMGLDKMRKDYINYFIGMELTTLNYLSYYLNTEIDLQEQLIRVKKLHHLLEIMETCTTFLNLPYERLFHFTQSCLQYYKTSAYNEDHAFQMQVKPAQISCLCQKEKPISWGVELSSGQGCREVKTSSYFSDKPLVDHATFDSGISRLFHSFTTVLCVCVCIHSLQLSLQWGANEDNPNSVSLIPYKRTVYIKLNM
uniref:Protein zwilch n=1 Tax=Denticeps clupeoides TaxID=299321 RepID=A0AAY4B6C1_9TELE